MPSTNLLARRFWLVGGWALVGAVIYHTLNGLRIIAINFSVRGPSREAKWFWATLILTVLLTIPSVIVIFANEL